MVADADDSAVRLLESDAPQGEVWRTGDPIPLDLIDSNPANPRKELTEIDLLADNIKQFGLLQPVIVRHAGDRYQLIGGHRRRAAYALLAEREPYDPQWRAIPAVVRSMDDDDYAYLALLSAQVHTVDFKPREEAAALERLVIGGLNLKQIGEKLNRTESWASKRLRVYSDSVLSGFVQAGKLPTTVAEELLTILDPDTRREYAQNAASEQWSQDYARGQVRALRLDKQLRMVSRSARELRLLLGSVSADQIPESDRLELLKLAQLVFRMAKQQKPRFPTIEQAQHEAKVSQMAVERDARKRRRVPTHAGKA